MLTESFLAATRRAEKQAQATNVKDIGIHVHEYQPIPSLKSSFKKSSTAPNCLAANATHIFAAQEDKSVVHVYNRERANQEAVIPFPEKLTALALTGRYDGAGALVLGTHGGRLILWEFATGRQISTPQSHLQAVTCLAVSPDSQYLLSGSSDSNIHVWSIPSMLSFSTSSNNDPSQPLPLSPVRVLSNHRATVSSIIFGHISGENNFALSAAQDQTCTIWDYTKGSVLHTYLLPSTPLCLALDPADRAAYVGYDDGSIQILDFYKQSNLAQSLDDIILESAPTQPPVSDRWRLPGASASSPLCIQVSYDGTSLLSGHKNGKIHIWNIGEGKYGRQLADFTLPVTNLSMLPPTGFPNLKPATLKLHNVVKPRYESILDASSSSSTGVAVPLNYTFTAQFTSTLQLPTSSSHQSDFQTALDHPSFPIPLLEKGIAELASLNNPSSDISDSNNGVSKLLTENANLTSQLNDALRRQREAIAEVLKMDRERFEKRGYKEAKRARKKRVRLRRMEVEERRRKMIMVEAVEAKADEGGAAEMDGVEDASSETDEMSDMSEN